LADVAKFGVKQEGFRVQPVLRSARWGNSPNRANRRKDLILLLAFFGVSE